jgi:hypothetical protein
MKIFEAFGELALRGAEVVSNGIAAVEEQGRSAADSLSNLADRASSVGDRMSLAVTGPIVAATAALAGFGLRAISTGDDLAKFSRAANISVETYQQLEFALGRVAGVSEQQTRQALERLNMAIANASNGNDAASESLQRLGFSLSEIRSGSVDTEAAMMRGLRMIREASTAAEAQAIAIELFGRRAGLAMANNIREGGETIEEAMAIYRREVGGFTTEQAEMAEAASDAWDLFKRSLSQASMQIGIAVLPVMTNLLNMAQESLIPAIVSATETVAGWIEAFSNLPKPIQLTVLGLIALVAAVGPALSIFARIMKLFLAVKAVVLALGAAKLFLAGALAVLLSPIILIGAALAGLAALIYLNWERIKELGSALASWASETWSTFSDWASGVGETVSEAASEWMQSISDFVSSSYASIAEWVSGIVESVGQLAQTVWAKIVEMATGVASRIRDMAAETWAAFSEWVRGIGAALTSGTSGWAQSIRDFISSSYAAISGWVSSFIEAVRQLPSVIGSVIGEMAAGVVGRIRSMVSDTLSALRRLYNEAVGNSIIPDLARDVERSMSGMADASIHQAERLSSGVLSALPETAEEGLVTAPQQIRSPAHHTRSGSGQEPRSVVYDMRHSIIRDDRDMLDRMMMQGANPIGAF